MTIEASRLADAIDPDLVVERTAACPTVARVWGGPFGEVATYLPGRRVPGVRLADGQVEVHVVARWGARVPDLAAEVRKAVGPIVAGLPVAVHVDDIDVDGTHSGPGTEIPLPDDA
jgi:hypothetical protein